MSEGLVLFVLFLAVGLPEVGEVEVELGGAVGLFGACHPSESLFLIGSDGFAHTVF